MKTKKEKTPKAIKTTPLQKMILQSLYGQKKPKTVDDIANHEIFSTVNFTQNAIRIALGKLVERGEVVKYGEKRPFGYLKPTAGKKSKNTQLETGES